jgi:S1-C subfamily serine protease
MSAVCLLATVSAARAVEVDARILDAEKARVAVMAEARSKTVAIFPPEGNGGGSGVLISADGYALSNFHVVRGSERAMKCGLSDGRSYDAVVVGIDPVGDVALVKIFGRDDFPFAELGDSDGVRLGDPVFAAGNPFLLAHDFQPTVTFGIVSGVHRYQYPAGTLLEYADCIQTDASINPGNSGGPLWDINGRLIGINGRGSFEKRGRVNVGVGYAISINQIKYFLGCMKSGRIVDHATLGARVASDNDGRVIVSDVLEDSDAYRRGLRIGDEIISFGGRSVRTVNAFKNVLGIFPTGWRVAMTFRTEGGETRDTFVRLQGVHNPEELLAKISEKVEPEKGLPPGRPQPKPEEPDGPKPDPGDKKEGGPKEEGQKPDGPEQDGPSIPKFRLPFGGGDEKEKPQTPEIVKKHFVERRGYANYFFNTQERNRVGRLLASRFTPVAGGNAATGSRGWTIAASEFAGGNPQAKSELTVKIDDAKVEYRLANGTATLTVGESLVESAEPEGSGGLLAALYLWRRLLDLGTDKFGDLQYEGAFSLPGSPVMYDVLIGRHGGATCRYFVDARGELVSLEMWRDDALDPCELFFSDYTDRQGRRLPGLIKVRYGDAVYTEIRPADWNFGAEATP